MSSAPEPLDPASGLRLLWTVPESAPDAAVTRSVALMAGEERARWDRLLHPPTRVASALGRLLLRELLSELTGIPRTEFGFRLGPHGRPEPFVRGAADESPLPSVNCAHTRGLVIVAGSGALGVQVGVDCESLDRPPPRRGLDRFFAAEEAAELFQLSDQARDRYFWRLWTLKEAWLKARGTGIAGSLSSTRIELPDHGPPRLLQARDDAPERWTLIEPEVRSGHRVAVAIDHPSAAGLPVRVTRLDPA